MQLDSTKVNIKTLRLKNGLTQEQLAEQTGLSTKTIHRIETEGTITKSSLKALSKVLGNKVYTLLDVSKNKILSENLVHFRKKNKMTQKDLADRSGLSKSFIQTRERETQQTEFSDIEKLATALDIDTELLSTVPLSDIILGENICKVRSEKQLDYDSLATATGYDIVYLKKIEEGFFNKDNEHFKYFPFLKNISSALDTKVETLFEGCPIIEYDPLDIRFSELFDFFYHMPNDMQAPGEIIPEDVPPEEIATFWVPDDPTLKKKEYALFDKVYWRIFEWSKERRERLRYHNALRFPKRWRSLSVEQVAKYLNYSLDVLLKYECPCETEAIAIHYIREARKYLRIHPTLKNNPVEENRQLKQALAQAKAYVEKLNTFLKSIETNPWEV